MIQEIPAGKLNASRFIEDKVRDIRAAAGEGTAMCALSGGVLSVTCNITPKPPSTMEAV